MQAVVTLVSLLVALSILVFAHELGHFATAKRSGVVVEEFGFGYPPRLLDFWHSRGKIVIGGQTIAIPRGFQMPEGLTVGASVVYEASADAKGRQVLERIEEVAPSDPRSRSAASVDLLDTGTVFTLNAIPFGGFAKMLGEEDPTFPGSLASKGKIVRTVVLAAGAGMNLLLAVAFFSLALGLGAPAVADPENAVVTAVAPGSPAEAAGLMVGDIILKADNTAILKTQDLLDYTQSHLGEQVVLTVQRGDNLLQIGVVPRLAPPQGEGPMGITLGPRTTIKHYKWSEETVSLVVLIISVPIQVVRGLIPADLARPVGPVGVGQIVGDAVKYSLKTGWWFPVMQMMGSLSVALAVTNLLPLPGLDGGRILFVIVEGIRGRRVDPAKEGLVHLIGMMLLVALMLFITWQDVIHPVPPLNWSNFY
jgi:regulator of sigma E protease